MTELEKLDAGLEYDFWDKEVNARKLRAIDLCAELNAAPEEDERIQALTHHLITQRWEPTAVDIIQEGGGKRRAMEAYFEHLGIAPEETIAFGDGANDIPMLETAGIGVAMGNASDEVKAHADLVSDACDAGGIWNALVALGVIEGARVERESAGQAGASAVS